MIIEQYDDIVNFETSNRNHKQREDGNQTI